MIAAPPSITQVRAVVSIHMIQRSVAVEVDEVEIEPIR
jgi:hypothetical protein